MGTSRKVDASRPAPADSRFRPGVGATPPPSPHAGADPPAKALAEFPLGVRRTRRQEVSEPIYCQPGAPLSVTEMRIRYSKLGLLATCMLSLWLMASFLDQESSQNNLHKISRTCHCPRMDSRKCGCPPSILSCSLCLHLPGESDWFDQRFQKAIEPLQRSEESASSDALILWLGLHRVQSEGFEKRKQHPTNVPPRRPLGHVGSRCLTCAVVGNSWFLRGSGLGFRINQHDMVLRMNQAPVQGFETDVGNTTTMRIMYPEIASAQEPGTQLLLLPMNSSGLKFWIFQLPAGTEENKDKVLVISLNFLKYIQERWLDNQGQYPSLGLVALFYALHTCDQVSLFGFGTDHLKRWSHYWDDKNWFESTMHDPQAEHDVILRLQCEGKVAIYS
ncbi:uncharacterized protein C20orf173 homolog [Choloepus didactylus]|uniref:uncharacterized protein C20orf173 homolog n=1 Tax=Choloepus didactylus TaxID=27675 RepID=UPI0018A050DC|nr:uncharacterized protein C20orf173 homolog [Choloepus didactylus]